MSDLLNIEPNSWPRFGGLFVKDDIFRYIIDGHIYQARNLLLAGRRLSNGEIMEYALDYILDEYQQCPAFTIHTTGSEILDINMGDKFMLYQQLANGQYVELIPRQGQYQGIRGIYTLQVPLQGGQPENHQYPRINLRKLSINDINELADYMNSQSEDDHTDLDQILRILNSSYYASHNTEDNSFRQSYEDLLKQLYGNYTSFEQVTQMIQDNQVERYTVTALYGAVGFSILTIVGKNGITYMAKVQYNPITNQITKLNC